MSDLWYLPRGAYCQWVLSQDMDSVVFITRGVPCEVSVTSCVACGNHQLRMTVNDPVNDCGVLYAICWSMMVCVADVSTPTLVIRAQ